MIEPGLLHDDPYEKDHSYEEQEFYILKTLNLTRGEIEELPRNHRIALYLRCYKDHLEHKFGYHRALSMGSEEEGGSVDDAIAQTIVEMRPKSWPVEEIK